jgi:hypothetical protein
MRGEAIGTCDVEEESKDTTVLLLWEDERRPSRSFKVKK